MEYWKKALMLFVFVFNSLALLPKGKRIIQTFPENEERAPKDDEN